MKRILTWVVAIAAVLTIGVNTSEAALRGRVRGLVRNVNIPVIGNRLNRHSGYTVATESAAPSEAKSEAKSDEKKAPTPAPKSTEKPAKSG